MLFLLYQDFRGNGKETDGYENDEQRISKHGLSQAGMQVCTKNLQEKSDTNVLGDGGRKGLSPLQVL